MSVDRIDCVFCGEIFVSLQGTPRSVCDSCMSVLFSTYKEKETLASTQERFLK